MQAEPMKVNGVNSESRNIEEVDRFMLCGKTAHERGETRASPVPPETSTRGMQVRAL